MSLSVTGASSALAALQTLSLQASDTAKSSTATSSPAQSSPASSAVSVSTAAAGPQSLYALVDGISQAVTAGDTADAAGQTVLGLLQQLQDTAGRASDPAATPPQRAALQQGFQASVGQLGPAIAAASVNGVNLLDGSQVSGLKVALGDGATASLTPVDLTLGGPTLKLAQDASVATATAAASAFASLGGAIGAAGAALSTLRGQTDQVSAHGGFVQALGQALGAPGGDEGDEGDSIRLTALQLSQQLSAQPGAIANQSPQSILSLFRN